MAEGQKPDLSSIEPIGRAPDAEADNAAEQEGDRVGHVAADVSGTPAAVVVEPDADLRQRPTEPRTSPETEEELDRLRRG